MAFVDSYLDLCGKKWLAFLLFLSIANLRSVHRRRKCEGSFLNSLQPISYLGKYLKKNQPNLSAEAQKFQI